ncbi:DUF1403 family protein [Phaeovulum sp. NW3]|uniref:DUF1403 family protein n=1 Tax=Phaeovulum sp. NW3 TaxID=2934933 RepID=UPI002020CC37|nr:DUF1403 family protein [Phaeovulum sp. NW3]MCL7464730.1 DUF1403 family protein [Phaeovulum sp. NW3]
MPRSRTNPVTPARVSPPIPGWVIALAPDGAADAAFRSGAVLAHLHLVATGADVPQALWRERLALAAAEVCLGLSGRREGQGALRDALHLTRPGDHPGPVGAVFRQWSRAVARPILIAHLKQVLDGVPEAQIALCLGAAGGNPIDRAAGVIEAVLSDHPRAETAALILADAVLAKAIGWDHILPLLSLGMKPRDLRLRGDDLRLACHRAAVAGARQAVPLAADLARRAARVRAVVPKLRAKGAGRAVDLFLSRDAVAPSALGAFMSDRAARRLCDRLVALGVIRELTGRDTFRLYGV